jgi:phthalate 4,5-dioxygenase oxygenase subunit
MFGNERLTRIGPGTPAGELLRRYWQPALLSRELPEPDGAPCACACWAKTWSRSAIRRRSRPRRRVLPAPPRADVLRPQRRVRLRCVYHGWKFDKHGTCVDMPSEPPDSLFKTKVTIKPIPTWEGGG